MATSRARKITIAAGYEVQVRERARGQESAYFVAGVYKDGAEVGHARNNGTGGATMIHPRSLEQQLEQLVDAEASKAGIDPAKLGSFERTDIVFLYALAKSGRGGAAVTLPMFLGEWAREMAS